MKNKVHHNKYFTKYGEAGPYIIFFPGANSEPEFYDKLLTRLAKNNQVYGLKYPGIGNDIKLERNNLEDYLKYIDDAIKETISDEKFYLMGFSIGGYLAIKYSEQNLDKIIELKLFSPLTKLRSQSILLLGLRELINELQNKFSGSRTLPLSIFSPKNLKYLKAKREHSKFVVNLKSLPLDYKLPNIKSTVVIGENDVIIDSQYSAELFKTNENYKIIKSKFGHDAFYLDMDKLTRDTL